MIKIVCFGLFVTLASASLRGVVTPVTQCGGNGTLVQLRISECEGAPPCTVTPNTDIFIEEDFIPSYNIPLAKIRLYINGVGPIYLIDEEIGTLIGGQLYTVSLTIRISNALAGQIVEPFLDIYEYIPGMYDRADICSHVKIYVSNVYYAD